MWNNWYVFDVCVAEMRFDDELHGQHDEGHYYVPYPKYKEMLDHYGIRYLAPLDVIDNPSMETIADIVNNRNTDADGTVSMSGNKEWTEARDSLVDMVTGLGFPEELGHHMARMLGSPKAIRRMTKYLEYAMNRTDSILRMKKTSNSSRK